MYNNEELNLFDSEPKKKSKLEFEDNPLEPVGDDDGSEEFAEEFDDEEFYLDDVTEEVGDDDGSEIIDDEDDEDEDE